MKFLKVLMTLIILAGPVMAKESQKVVLINDFDSSLQGFSLTTGKLITVDQEAGSLPMEIDFIFDIPNGVGMNNSQLGDWFHGEAMILDLGDIPINKKIDLPDADLAPYLIPSEIVEGHTYMIQTADANHYGRIKIVQFDEDNSTLSFTWVYLNTELQ
jgi:hypothetical protein